MNYRVMKNLLAVFFCGLVMFPSICLSQGKKTVKKYNLKSTTINTTEFVDGKELTHVESVEKYDKEGNVIEDIEYNKDGTFRKKEIRQFNKAGDITQESRYDEHDVLISKLVITYNDSGDKLSEQKTDGS